MNISIGQGMAGEDKAICLNGSVQIGNCTNNQLNCDWYVYDETEPDPSKKYKLIASSQHHLIVTPTKTSIYMLEVTDPRVPIGSTTIDYVTVYVIEDVILSVEDNIAECMEKMTLNFAADVIMHVPSSIATQPKLNFKFNFEEEGVPTIIEPFTLPDATSISVDHKLIDLPVNGSSSFLSASVEVDLLGTICNDFLPPIKFFDFAIHKLTGKNITGTQKELKIVVDYPTFYEFISSTNCSAWNIEMPQEPNSVSGKLGILSRTPP